MKTKLVALALGLAFAGMGLVGCDPGTGSSCNAMVAQSLTKPKKPKKHVVVHRHVIVHRHVVVHKTKKPHTTVHHYHHYDC